MDLVRSFLFHPLINALWTWGLINKGQTLVIINGGHGLMGGTLWELSKLMMFIKNLIRNRSFGE